MRWVIFGYRSLLVLGVTTLGSALLARSLHASQGTPAEAASPQFYTEHVQPIFQENCYRCHAGLNHRGGLQLDSAQSILRGGRKGPVIVPGSPEQSLLVKLIRHEGTADDPMPMPPKSKLSDTDIATITAWVRAGAAMPPDAAHER
jgi:mono/diheme cytochrome c family protein